MRTFLQQNVVVGILTMVFLVMGIAYGATTSTQHNQETAQEQEIAELDAGMQAALTAAKTRQGDAIDKAAGTDAQRVAADTELIRGFVQTVATWDSGQEYVEARESVTRRYGLGEDSQFMKAYFQAPVSNTDSSGNTFYLVDTEGLNSTLSSVEVRPLEVRGTAYRYMVLADVSSASNDGKARATKTSVIYLTLDGEGTMSEVSGFASLSAPLTSG